MNRLLALLAVVLLEGCASTHSPATDQVCSGDLLRYVLGRDDPALRQEVNAAPSVVVVPDLFETARTHPGTACNGMVYQEGQLIGTAWLHAGSSGVSCIASPTGAIVVIEDKESVVALKSGYLSLCPNALAAGIGDDTTQENAYCDGIAVFVGDPHLAGAPIAEWLIDFEPLDDLAHVAGNVP